MNCGIKILIFLIFTLNSNASTLKISYYNLETKFLALSIKKYLTHKYSIPEEVIGIDKEVVRCNSSFRKLCLNKKGELKKLSFKDINFFKKSFLIFSQRTKNEL